MATTAKRGERRVDALSKERIVDAAIAMLDAQGEAALTFRALAARLATGSGAIYWHVANKNDLLCAATEVIMTRALDGVVPVADPQEAIRAIALSAFDAIDAHPWVGAQLSQEPSQPAMLTLLEGVGGRLRELGVPTRAQFDSASALLNFILGVAGQNASAARLGQSERERPDFLAGAAERWLAEHDAGQFPFVAQIAGELSDHDDRAQFLAGINLILAGIRTLR